MRNLFTDVDAIIQREGLEFHWRIAWVFPLAAVGLAGKTTLTSSSDYIVLTEKTTLISSSGFIVLSGHVRPLVRLYVINNTTFCYAIFHNTLSSWGALEE